MSPAQETPELAIPTTEQFAECCANDGEMVNAVRHWTGGLRLVVGDTPTGFTVTNGSITAGVPNAGDEVIAIAGPAEAWAPTLQAVPPRLTNTISTMVSLGLERASDPLLWWQYLPAVERAIELLRPPAEVARPVADESGSTPRHDSPVGRYIHVEIAAQDYRIYYEEAGQGIPLLLQHTAGANGLQWRHLFEVPEITDHFRLIAYDLPFHGKSIPPVGARWWEEPYRLEGPFLRQVPVSLAAALELDRPAFMGCSVGGLLALDLARHHSDRFRAVVSLEGALHIGGDWEGLLGMWHPQVSNQSKARMMEGLCSPTSPEAYVKEVSQVYSAGWPPAFWGDLYYYLVDYDLRDDAHEIDTTRTAVHIMNGEYDYSGTIKLGRAAHEAIAGSTFTELADIGHFPMAENPSAFIPHLLPVLASIHDGP